MGAFTRTRQGRHRGDRSTCVLAPLSRACKERYAQAAGTMSGGEQQMLVIGRALMAKPQPAAARRAVARHRAEARAGHRPLDRRHQSRREGERAAGRAELAHGAPHLAARLCADHRIGGAFRRRRATSSTTTASSASISAANSSHRRTSQCASSSSIPTRPRR